MSSYLDAYKNAIDEEKKSMSEAQLAEFEQNLAEERKLIEEHEKTMVRHDESEFIMDERGIDGGEEDDKYPEADDPEELLKQTNDIMNCSEDKEEVLNKLNDLALGIKADDETEKFHKNVLKMVVKENDLKTERIEVKPVLVRAYCPKCGKEIVSSMPPMYNPFNFEKVNMHKCGTCGWTGNLEHSYPRIVFIDAQNNEYDAYTK